MLLMFVRKRGVESVKMIIFIKDPIVVVHEMKYKPFHAYCVKSQNVKSFLEFGNFSRAILVA